jgi:predicted dehydrogenase
MYINQLRRFALVAAGKATPLVGLDHALYTLKVIDSLRHSAAERQPVSLRGI